MCAGVGELLNQVPLVNACTPAERRTIARAADYVQVPAGAVVSSKNERINPVVIVAHGELSVIGSDGVTTAREGSVIGAAELLARRARSGQVVTTTDADLVLIEPRRFLPLLERCPNLAVELLRTLARDSLAEGPRTHA
jgi:CRP-like cAMP-binding protein